MKYLQDNRFRHFAIMLLGLLPLALPAQTVALKTNLLYDALATPSLGVEHALSSHTSVGVMATYNPFSFGERRWRSVTLQPELRFWKTSPFYGFFLGVNAFGGGFNINKVHVGGLADKHRQGNVLGGGLSVGYHFILSNHFDLEFVIGANCLYATYDRFSNGELEGHFTDSVVLPVGTGLNLSYIIK